MASNYVELNLDEAVQKWASDLHEISQHDTTDSRTTFQHYKAPQQHPFKYQANFSKVKFSDSDPEFHHENIRESDPKSEVLHDAVLTNDTATNQEYSLDIQRETTSLARINITRGMVLNGKTRLSVQGLPSRIPGTSGFGRKLVVEEIESQEFKEKIKWKINTRVTVPGKSKVRAEVLVNENIFEAKYSTITEIRGNIHVDVLNAKNNSYISSLDGNIVTVLRHHSGEDFQGLTFSNSGRTAFFKSTAACSFRFGVTEVVNIKPE